MTEVESIPELIAAAELLGRLLLREVDREALEGLRGLGPAIGPLEAFLPGPSEDERAWLEARAADYHELILGPGGSPLVQSLWTEGRYEGEAAGRVAALARAAGYEHDPAAARGAVRDHLGCLLLLHARAAGDPFAAPVADELVRAHLTWALAPLRRVQGHGGFYGELAHLTSSLIEALSERAPDAAAGPDA